MLLYVGHQVVVNLTDGSAIRGRLGWPWVWGCMRLLNVESLDDADVGSPVPGVLVVPRSRVMIVQVL